MNANHQTGRLPLRARARVGSRSRSRSRRGFALIEVLVAGLIFAFGVLGIVGLQAQMSRAQTTGKSRVDAINLASELIGTMWGDGTSNLGKFDTTQCATYATCNAWLEKLERTLPGGSAQVEIQAQGVVFITISWTSPEGTGTYTTQTAMVI